MQRRGIKQEEEERFTEVRREDEEEGLQSREMEEMRKEKERKRERDGWVQGTERTRVRMKDGRCLPSSVNNCIGLLPAATSCRSTQFSLNIDPFSLSRPSGGSGGGEKRKRCWVSLERIAVAAEGAVGERKA